MDTLNSQELFDAILNNRLKIADEKSPIIALFPEREDKVKVYNIKIEEKLKCQKYDSETEFHEIVFRGLWKYREYLFNKFQVQIYAFPLYNRKNKNLFGDYIVFTRLLDSENKQIAPLLIKKILYKEEYFMRHFGEKQFILHIGKSEEKSTQNPSQNDKLDNTGCSELQEGISDKGVFKISLAYELVKNELFKHEEEQSQSTENKTLFDHVQKIKEKISDKIRNINGDSELKPAFFFEHDVEPVFLYRDNNGSFIVIYETKVAYYLLPRSMIVGSIDLNFSDIKNDKKTLSFSYRTISDKYKFSYSSEIVENIFKISNVIISDSAKDILISAPSGSGKESYAKLISIGKSHLYPGKFVPINTAGDYEDVSKRIFGEVIQGNLSLGLIEKSKNGVLFMDEIEKSDEKLRSALLRVIESGDYYPLKSNTPQNRGKHTLFLFASANPQKITPEDFLNRLVKINLKSPLKISNVCKKTIFWKKTCKRSKKKEYLRNLVLKVWVDYFVDEAKLIHESNKKYALKLVQKYVINPPFSLKDKIEQILSGEIPDFSAENSVKKFMDLDNFREIIHFVREKASEEFHKLGS